MSSAITSLGERGYVNPYILENLPQTTINRITRDLDWLSEATFSLEDGEKLVMADEAEWVETGNERNDPDGILYLTTKRLVFEQKETLEKRFGLFGGGDKHELELALDLVQLGIIAVSDNLLIVNLRDDDTQYQLRIKAGDVTEWQKLVKTYMLFPPVIVMPTLPAGEPPANLADFIQQMAEKPLPKIGQTDWQISISHIKDTLAEKLVDPIELVAGLGNADPKIRLGLIRILALAIDAFATNKDRGQATYALLSVAQYDTEATNRADAVIAINSLCMKSAKPDSITINPPELKKLSPYLVAEKLYKYLLAYDSDLNVRLKALRFAYLPHTNDKINLIYGADDVPLLQGAMAWEILTTSGGDLPDPERPFLELMVDPLRQYVSEIQGINAPTNIIKASIKLDDPRFAPVIIPYLDSTGDRNLIDAITAVGLLGITEAEAKIITHLAHKSAQVRKSVVDALGDLGNPASIAVLEAHQQTETDKTVIDSIAFSIKLIHGVKPDTYEELVSIINNRIKSVPTLRKLIPQLQRYPDRIEEIVKLVTPMFTAHRCRAEITDLIMQIGDERGARLYMTAALSGGLEVQKAANLMAKLGVPNGRAVILGQMGTRQKKSYLRNENSSSPSKKFPDKF